MHRLILSRSEILTFESIRCFLPNSSAFLPQGRVSRFLFHIQCLCLRFYSCFCRNHIVASPFRLHKGPSEHHGLLSTNKSHSYLFIKSPHSLSFRPKQLSELFLRRSCPHNLSPLIYPDNIASPTFDEGAPVRVSLVHQRVDPSTVLSHKFYRFISDLQSFDPVTTTYADILHSYSLTSSVRRICSSTHTTYDLNFHLHKKYSFGFCHGDFASYNLFYLSCGSLVAIDWEHLFSGCSQYFDAIHFLICKYSLFFPSAPPTVVLRDLFSTCRNLHSCLGHDMPSFNLVFLFELYLYLRVQYLRDRNDKIYLYVKELEPLFAMVL